MKQYERQIKKIVLDILQDYNDIELLDVSFNPFFTCDKRKTFIIGLMKNYSIVCYLHEFTVFLHEVLCETELKEHIKHEIAQFNREHPQLDISYAELTAPFMQ